ncbi:hypothetical protein AAXE64_08355 [Priestia megaterium]
MYYTKTIGQRIVKHVNGKIESIIKHAESEAWAFGYCDILKDDKIIMTAHKSKDNYKVQLIKY